MLKGVEVHFSPETEQKLNELAAQNGSATADELVQRVIAGYIEEQCRFIEAVRRGEEAFGRGEYLTHEQVGERLRCFL